MMELAGSILVLLGAIFHFSAGLGMLRMPDAYTRMQAGTKASTLGNTLVLAGLAFCHPGWALKLLIIIYFVLMTNPISSHALARAAHRLQLSTACDARGDALRDMGKKARRRDFIRSLSVAVAIAAAGLVFLSLALTYTEQESLRPLAEGYIRLVPQELGAPNVVTGILLTYRAFDTLGEVAVLFMAAASVGMILGPTQPLREEMREEVPEKVRPSSEIVQSGAGILAPMIAIFAAYIIMNGHLSAGGGFQGGAVIASGVLLMLLAYPRYRLALDFLSFTESVAGVLFVLVGVAGLVFAGGFLDNRILPIGQFGAIFSAGAIPVLSMVLGIKVGCELSVVLDSFRPVR